METDLIITVESKPRLLHLALAFAGGVIAGILGAFLIQKVTNSIYTGNRNML